MRTLRMLACGLVLSSAACNCGETGLISARASLAVAPVELDFGRVGLGQSATREVVFSLAGNRPVGLDDAAFLSDGAFSSDFAAMSIDPEKSAIVHFTFHPQAVGAQSASWVVHTDLEDPATVQVELKGEGVEGATCIDMDGDTFGDACPPGPDCDDSNRLINPNQHEQCGNGLDDDCNPGTPDACPSNCVDKDGDGYGDGCALGLDCDDYKVFINPGQPERCGNVYDDDCNPATTDACPITCPTGGCGVGCADGTREGFLDEARYPAIAACAGGFAIPGVFHEEAPACGRNAGNSSSNPNGSGCNASDLCAAGWHICRHQGEVAAKSPDGCAGALVAAGSFFATRQSGPGCSECATGIDPARQCAGNDCATDCYPNDRTTNDVFGCGTGGTQVWGSSCGVLDRFSYDVCSGLSAPWNCSDSSGTDEALRIVKPGSDGGGVLCCAD